MKQKERCHCDSFGAYYDRFCTKSTFIALSGLFYYDTVIQLDLYGLNLLMGLHPSAGFGMGMERQTRYICGISHIWEYSPIPKIIDCWKDIVDQKRSM
jgi:hypothetical protein